MNRLWWAWFSIRLAYYLVGHAYHWWLSDFRDY